MTEPRSIIPTDPHEALKAARQLWLALLGGIVMVAVMTILTRNTDEPDSELNDIAKLLFYINCGMLLVGLMVGYVLRNQFYKRHWEGDVVKPKGYMVGNMVLWCITESCAFFSLTLVMMTGALDPYIWPGVGATLSFVINYPNGRILFPPRESLS